MSAHRRTALWRSAAAVAQLRFVVTFDLAKETLLAERRAERPMEATSLTSDASQAFNTAVTTRTPGQMARVEAIRRQMEEWRQKKTDRDFGREM
jgi:hypothetical protein